MVDVLCLMHEYLEEVRVGGGETKRVDGSGVGHALFPGLLFRG